MTKTSFYLYEMFFKALSNKTRFKIIQFLKEGPKTVNEICNKLNFEQSRVSHNLKRLEHCGFLTCKTKGKNRVYSVDKHIFQALKNIDKYFIINKNKLKTCLIN